MGASETHPLEGRMVLHIQTTSPEYPAADILVEGFKTINQLYSGIENTFTKTYSKFSK